MSSTNPEHHAGAEWVAQNIAKSELSPLGVRVADLLGYLHYGIYHLNPTSLRKVEWGNNHHIAVVVYDNYYATTDFDYLTRLVFLAHHLCLRVSVEGAAPNYLRLIFHPRQRTGEGWQRHPSLDEAVSAFKATFDFLEVGAVEQVMPC